MQSHAHLQEQHFILLKDIREFLLVNRIESTQKAHHNPLNSFGKKCFSQSDEDGITLEIIRRMGLSNMGTFAEFGVGDGTENNTLILKALGWKGFWVGGEDLSFGLKGNDTDFAYLKSWITIDNILELTQQGQNKINSTALDVISLDLDGNDYYFVEALLSAKIHPKLFIVEYNSKFPPPIKWKISYDTEHQWQGDDYYGASLCSFVEIFEKFNYKLVCCNAATGCNAFFVHQDYHALFADVPNDLEKIYVGPRYFLLNAHGHPNAKKTIEKIMNATF